MKYFPSSVACALFLSAVSAWCQVNTASLTGLIRDSSNAVITDAKVTARNPATGIERESRTNESGYYFFANLPVGNYELSVEKTSFEKAVTNVTLDATEKGRQDFTLAVGTVATVTSVQAAAPLLSPDDASLGSVVENKYVTEYPLLLRSWDDLVNLVAGVQGQRYTDQGGSTSAGRTAGFGRELPQGPCLYGVD
jgi:hypothetical protein